jgi:hypothetical protein
LERLGLRRNQTKGGNRELGDGGETESKGLERLALRRNQTQRRNGELGDGGETEPKASYP